MEKGSCGNREPAKKRQKECSRSEEANRERLLLGFNVFHKEVREPDGCIQSICYSQTLRPEVVRVVRW